MQMKPAAEIIAANTNDEGETDLEACIQAFESIPAAVEFRLSDLVQIQQAHTAHAVLWIADLVLQLLEQQGALPLGREQEMTNVKLAMDFDRSMRFYELIRSKYTGGLVIPNR